MSMIRDDNFPAAAKPSRHPWSDRRQQQDTDPPPQRDDRLLRLWHKGNQFAAMGHYEAAIACYDQVAAKGRVKDAQFWCDRGEVLRSLSRYHTALGSLNIAIALQPQSSEAWSSRGVVLALLGRHQDAVQSCNRAVELNPNGAAVWNARGLVLMIKGLYHDALPQFERALALQPNFAKASHNRGVVLLHLERIWEATESFAFALEQPAPVQEPWYANAWIYYGYALLKLGYLDRAIACFDRALECQPGLLPAALYKLMCLALTGKIFTHILKPTTRSAVWREIYLVLYQFRYGLTVTGLWAGILLFGHGHWVDWLRGASALLLSVAVVLFIVADLWHHKARIGFVWKTYFHNHPFTYVRSLAIALLTVTIYGVAALYAPTFLQWGWANLIFQQPGNLLLQPLNLLHSTVSLPHPTLHPALPWMSLMAAVGMGLPVAIAGQWLPPLNLNYSAILIVLFWCLLMLGIPFWARFEERIFRRGANTWKMMVIRSTQFGFVHLLAGIPILGGVVLIIPGFLFACRYKFVHDRHLHHTQDPLAAQDAGVAASTADHAVYNAILVTLAITLLLFLP